MGNWKRGLIVAFGGLLFLALLLLVLGILFSHFLIDLWWYLSLNFGGYFWLRLLYRYILAGGVTLFFFILFFANFWIASRYLGRSARGRVSKGWIHKFQTGAMEVYTPLSLVMGIILAIPFYQQWEAGLLFFFGPGAGVDDPLYGNDVSFYLFRLPIFLMLQRGLLATFLILFVGVGFLYWLENRVIPVERQEFPEGVRIHLSILAFLSALVLAWGLMLQRFALLYVDDHEPTFYGPGFVEVYYHLPLIWLALLAFLIAAVAFIFYANLRRSLYLVIGITGAVVFLVAAGLRHVTLIPEMLNQYIVKANPVTTEGRFMKNNIEATLAAYRLDGATAVNFEVSQRPETDIGEDVADYINNIPVWDENFLYDVYQQLQGLRPYYRFSPVDVARYTIHGRVQQVNLAARELNLSKLPASVVENWENIHLRYTHGYGVVMTPAAQEGDRPMEWYIRDLTLYSPVGFKIDTPDIYYGQENLTYAIVPNKLEVAELPGTKVTPQQYQGGGGVEIKSLFRKLIAAVYFQDPKIFFSINIGEESRLRIRRNIIERIRELTPYLMIDSDPYVIVTDDRLYWLIDAYTTSDWYPISKPTTLEGREREINYIRNSVKIVIDAYDGHVDFYVADPEDPIIRAYARAFPGVFKPIGAMPHVIQTQLRYPRDFFRIQMQIYAKYHQREPELFFQQADTWDFAKVKDVPKLPYYLTVQLVEKSHPQLQPFVQISPLTPIGRDNLRALAIAGVRDLTEGPYVPELVVYQFKKEVQVDGPAQIDALIDQDPEISAAFTLWNQQGSEVKRGRIIVLPVGHSVLYVQPVYLIAAGETRIPQLTRIIVSMGNVVVMERSLKEAFDRLRQELIAKTMRELELRGQTLEGVNPGAPLLPLPEPAREAVSP
ncbi:UPF0182 family protein [Methylomarinovum caldicuralii]|nr:UPF0182 family protein [Methylomarinovum caldicuralii]